MADDIKDGSNGEKKDLTHLVPTNPGESLELELNPEQAPEAVQQFESLDDFARTANSISDSNAAPVETAQAPSEAQSPVELDLNLAPLSLDFPHDDSSAQSGHSPGHSPGHSVDAFGGTFANAPQGASGDAPLDPGMLAMPAPELPVSPPPKPVSKAPAPAVPTFPISSRDAAPPESALENVRKTAEAAPTPFVPASYPFHLTITGPLAPEEKERLLELLSQENMGIREVDLEPQFAAEKLLIPRISEYAGVMLVQALRGTRARMRLFPSDSESENQDASADGPLRIEPSAPHPADALPITRAAALAEFPTARTLETLTASAALLARTVEAQDSQEFQNLLEALKREIRYRAHRKGACAIVNFGFTLSNLNLPTHYRLTVTGDAIIAV